MAGMERYVVTVTTDGDGNGTGYTGVAMGFVQAIRYVKTDYTDGVDFDVTCESSGMIVWDQDNVNATVTVHPRAATADILGVASLYAGSGEPVETLIPVAGERVKIQISSGGSAHTGTFHVYVGG